MAAIERGLLRTAALDDCAVGQDERGLGQARNAFDNAAAKDVDACGLSLVDRRLHASINFPYNNRYTGNGSCKFF